MTIAIDIGNTRAKLGLWLDKAPPVFWQAQVDHLEASLKKGLPYLKGPCRVGWISVANPDFQLSKLDLWKVWEKGQLNLTYIGSGYPFPIKNRYATPQTLGTDRMVGIVAAKARCPNTPVLVIDAGTALTFDFATADGEYLGGAISPGLGMRLRALHEFTARLPLIEIDDHPDLVGNTTKRSIQSGAYYGTLVEIEGMVQRYRHQYGADVQVFLTGGDIYRFENQLTCLNFADSNLILKGILHLITDSHFS